MKAERRHELQTNALAKWLADVPLYLRFHFGKILLGLLVLILVVMLIRQRMVASQTSGLEAMEGLNEARRLVSQLPSLDFTEPDAPKRAAERRRATSQAEGLIEQVIAQTSDPDDSALRAEAYVLRGDLYWTLANLPEVPGATTQPALLSPRKPDDYLKDAAEAYQQVLRTYPQRTTSAVTAMFGLAAIAENRGDWDGARAQYEALARQPNVPEVTKTLATQRMEYLSRLQEPLYTGTVTSQPSTQPATQPSTEPSAP